MRNSKYKKKTSSDQQNDLAYFEAKMSPSLLRRLVLAAGRKPQRNQLLTQRKQQENAMQKAFMSTEYK